MPPLPKTKDGLIALGYKFSGVDKCRRCRADIQWFVTTNSAWMPFDMPDDKGEFDNHWATCPHAKEFKKKR